MKKFQFYYEEIAIIFYRIFALIMGGLAITGTIKSYSSAWYWDMWDGYLLFYYHIFDGNWGALFDYHNEHLILITRIFFLIDLIIFNGNQIFLLIIIYILILIFSIYLYKIIHSEKNLQGTTNISRFIIFSFIFGWVFLWTQRENFIWGFQIQFILSILIPFVSFYYYCQSLVIKENKNFILSCIFGFLSVFTMASGLFVMPTILLLEAIFKRRYWKMALLLSINILIFSLYFIGKPNGASNMINGLFSDPLNVFIYFISYMGNIFSYLSGSKNTIFPIMGGSIFILLYIFQIYSYASRKESDHNRLILLSFILFCIIGALLTALGRFDLGLGQSLSSRYTTPVIFSWASLIIIFWMDISSSWNIKSKLFYFILFIIAILALRFQLSALKPPKSMLFERDLAVLSLALGISDNKQIENSVYHTTSIVLPIAERAYILGLGPFSQYPFKNIKESMGNQVLKITLSECAGGLDDKSTFEIIKNSSKFIKVGGWIFNPISHKVPRSIQFLNDSNEVVGYAISGVERPDVKAVLGSSALYSGFRGYILSSQSKRVLFINALDNKCTIKSYFNGLN